MKRLLLLFLCVTALFIAAHWEEELHVPCQGSRVLCVSNFPVDASLMDGISYLEFKAIAPQLKRKKGRFHALLRQLHLDLPRKLTLPKGVDKLLFFNIDPHREKKCDLHKLPKEKMVVFLFEPPSVIPRLYDPSFLECFSKIYTWRNDLVDGKRFFKFNPPVQMAQGRALPPFEERKLCTLVASNLVSSHPDELYSKRKEAIAYFERAAEAGFEFYGKRWEKEGFASYRGAVPDKIETIKNYRFSICFENMKEIDGYISEKIFDCFAAGTVPIYWGARNISDCIPQGCYIDFRDFKDFEELHTFLKAMGKQEYERYQACAQAFMESEHVRPFSHEQFLRALSDALADRDGNKL